MLQTDLVFSLNTVTLLVDLQYITHTENSKALQILALYQGRKGSETDSMMWPFDDSVDRTAVQLIALCYRRTVKPHLTW